MDIVAKAALFNERDELLVLTRSRNDEYRPGEVDLPGGCVEVGERLAAGIVREVSEEVGIRLAEDDLALVFAETGVRKNRGVTRYLYMGKISMHDSVLLSHEHEAWEWQPLEDAVERFGTIDWRKGLQYLLERCIIR